MFSTVRAGRARTRPPARRPARSAPTCPSAPGCERVVIRQGEEMGRPSVLEVEMVDGRPRVGGGVIPVIDGEVSLP